MDWIKQLHYHFPQSNFANPNTDREVDQAEDALEARFPPVLRELYLQVGGFRLFEATGIRALLPLLGSEGLVALNTFFRSGAEFPNAFASQCVFFGEDGVGGYWGVKQDLPGKVIYWRPEWANEFDIVGSDPFEVWQVEKKIYDQVNNPSPNA